MTVKFGRTTNYAMNRFWLYLVYYNMEKPPGIEKPAEMRYRNGGIAGLPRELINDATEQPRRKRCFLRIWRKAL